MRFSLRELAGIILHRPPSLWFAWIRSFGSAGSRGGPGAEDGRGGGGYLGGDGARDPRAYIYIYIVVVVVAAGGVVVAAAVAAGLVVVVCSEAKAIFSYSNLRILLFNRFSVMATRSRS